MKRVIGAAALAALAGGAQAQDACATLPGTLAESAGNPAAAMFDQMLSTDAQGALRVPFTLEADADLRLEAAPVGEGDPEIVLHDGDGAELASDDDGGGGLSSRVEAALSAGDYCLLTRNLSGQEAQFALRIATQDQPALTPGAAASAVSASPAPCMPDTEAVALADGPIDDSLEAGLSRADSVNAAPYLRFSLAAPYLRFSLAAPQAITIRAASQAADPSIALYDALGVQVAANDDFDGLNAQIDLSEPLAAGEYCLGVSALSDPTAPIQLTVSRFDEAAYFERLYRTGAASPPPGGDYPVVDLGVVGGAVVRDLRLSDGVSWFALQIDAESLVEIRAVALSQGGDLRLQLHDGLGARIAENDDDVDLNPRIAPLLSPGHYMLGVGTVGDGEPGATGQGGPARLSIRRFVPAE